MGREARESTAGCSPNCPRSGSRSLALANSMLRQMEMCSLVNAVIPQEEGNYVVLNTLWVRDRERSRNRTKLII